MTEEELREKAADYLYLRITGIEKALERMDDRMSSIEGFFDYLQKRIAELSEDKPQSDAQWTEERLRALEDKVKCLDDMKQRHCDMLGKIEGLLYVR